MILLDVEKAFDAVWHDGLVFKLIKHQVPTFLIKIIASFITNRSFFVDLHGVKSENKPIEAGCPQGSILSPLLFNLFISDAPTPRECNVAFYADDTAIITSAKNTKVIVKRLQRALAHMNDYFRNWKIQINVEKTQCIVFPFNKSPKRKPTNRIRFDSITLNWSDEVTYLGVLLDRKLSFGPHIKKARSKSMAAFMALFPLLGRRSRLSRANKYLLFTAVIRPIMAYGAPIWAQAATSHLKTLQITQNKVLKTINGLHWRFPTIELHRITGFAPVKEYVNELASNFALKCSSSSYHHLSNLVDH